MYRTIMQTAQPNTKTYQTVVNKTLKDGTVVSKTYTKHYNVLTDEEKLNKQKNSITVKQKLLREIRKHIKSYEHDYVRHPIKLKEEITHLTKAKKISDELKRSGIEQKNVIEGPRSRKLVRLTQNH